MITARSFRHNFQPPDPSQQKETAESYSSEWAGTALARLLDEREHALLSAIMPRTYRPVCVQVSGLDTRSALDLSPGGVSFHITLPGAPIGDLGAPIRALPEALPFASRSVDLVILSHVLEFADNPHAVLREVEQTLAPGGHIVLLGFNPTSLWGLRRLMVRLLRRKRHRPWRGNWLRLSRIRDWMRLLGLESTGGRIGVYGLPIQSERLNTRFAFLERVGARWWPRFGAVYAIVVMKQEISATPIRNHSRRNRRLRPGLVTPLNPNAGRSNRNS